MLESLAVGAHGFLDKESGVEQLPPALRAIAACQFVMGRDHIDELLRSHPAATAPLDGVAALTTAETQVLRPIAKGHTNREISGALCVAESIVKSPISHLLARTGARSRARAVALRYERGHPLC